MEFENERIDARIRPLTDDVGRSARILRHAPRSSPGEQILFESGDDLFSDLPADFCVACHGLDLPL